MKLLVGGCSFTWGDELQEPVEEKTWAYQVSKNLNFSEFVNLAVNGLCNESIYLKIINWLYDHQEEKDIFVLIGWTTEYRISSFINDLLTVHYKIPGIPRKETSGDRYQYDYNIFLEKKKFAEYFIRKEIFGSKKNTQDSLKVLINLQNFLKSKKINYFFCDSLSNHDKLKQFSEYHNLIDFKHYYISEGFYDFTKKNKFPIGKYYHPLEDAHIAWGNLISNEIRNRGIF